MDGKSQQVSAAASGMSVRTARTWQRGRLPSEKKGKQRWRTRPDPFAGVWIEEVEPLLRSDVEGALKATTILEWLDERQMAGAEERVLRGEEPETVLRDLSKRFEEKYGEGVETAGDDATSAT